MSYQPPTMQTGAVTAGTRWSWLRSCQYAWSDGFASHARKNGTSAPVAMASASASGVWSQARASRRSLPACRTRNRHIEPLAWLATSVAQLSTVSSETIHRRTSGRGTSRT